MPPSRSKSLGLGQVLIGAMRNHPEEVAAELGLPPHVMALFGMCVGYPDPAVATGVKPRLPQRAVLHREQYSAAGQPEPLSNTMNASAHFSATLASLHDRDRTREALDVLGFALR